MPAPYMHHWQCIEMDDGGTYRCQSCGSWHNGSPPPKVECCPDANTLLFLRLTNLARSMTDAGASLVLLKTGEIDERYKLKGGYVSSTDLLYGMANCFLESKAFTEHVAGKWVLTQCDEQTSMFINISAAAPAVALTDFFRT